MEIHPAHRPIDSLKDFFLQLLTITAGVLIALSLEALVEWNHYRRLVNEARETISREIRDNKREINVVLGSLARRRENLDSAIRFANQLLQTSKTDVHQLNLGVEFAELSAVGWQSAERTGAVGHMEYAEVQEYSRLYGLQQLYTDHQQRGLERVASALSILSNADPTKASQSDLEAFRQQVLALRADLVIEEQIGRRLAQNLDTMLKE